MLQTNHYVHYFSIFIRTIHFINYLKEAAVSNCQCIADLEFNYDMLILSNAEGTRNVILECHMHPDFPTRNLGRHL
jgi:hypothetical protein